MEKQIVGNLLCDISELLINSTTFRQFVGISVRFVLCPSTPIVSIDELSKDEDRNDKLSRQKWFSSYEAFSCREQGIQYVCDTPRACDDDDRAISQELA